MESIVVVSPHVASWTPFITELGSRSRKDVVAMHCGAEALAAAKDISPVAVVIDQDLGDMTGIDLVNALLETNAMIHVALVSDLSEEVFHESTEGLGILMRLPPTPDGQMAATFYERLAGVV